MNYTDVITAARQYADRKDDDVGDNMDVFIQLAEARMNRLLKTREQSTRAYVPTVEDQAYYSLPPDYAGMRDIQLNSDLPSSTTSRCTFHYLNPEQLDDKVRNGDGRLYYTIIANQIQITPMQAAGKTIEIVYYQKVPNLNVTNPTNWVSLSHPDMYVAGVTGEIELYVKNYDVSDVWFARLASIIDELDYSDEEERWSGNPLVTRIQ